MIKILDVRKFWEVAQLFVYMRYFFALCNANGAVCMAFGFETATEIAVAMGYDLRWVYRIHNQGLAAGEG